MTSEPYKILFIILCNFAMEVYGSPSLSVVAATATTLLSTVSATLSASASLQPNVTSLYVSVIPICADSGACAAAASPCCSLKYAVESVAAFMVPVTEPVPIMMGTGVYGVNSCGVNTARPLSIQGVSDVTIDCGGSDRVLSSSTSLFMSNLTLRGGHVSDGSNGGAVSVVSSDASPSFVFVGVVFVNNSVLHGNGGGLSISVSNGVQLTGVSVHLEEVVFEGNIATCAGNTCGHDDDGPDTTFVTNGGGVAILVDAPVVTGTSITFYSCQLFNNMAASPEFMFGYNAGNGGGVCLQIGGFVSDTYNITNTRLSFQDCSMHNNSAIGTWMPPLSVTMYPSFGPIEKILCFL
jgi:hypothetical protein